MRCSMARSLMLQNNPILLQSTMVDISSMNLGKVLRGSNGDNSVTANNLKAEYSKDNVVLPETRGPIMPPCTTIFMAQAGTVPMKGFHSSPRFRSQLLSLCKSLLTSLFSNLKFRKYCP